MPHSCLWTSKLYLAHASVCQVGSGMTPIQYVVTTVSIDCSLVLNVTPLFLTIICNFVYLLKPEIVLILVSHQVGGSQETFMKSEKK